MPSLSFAAIAAVLTVFWLVYKLVLQPAFLSPLAKIPAAHWSARISSIWIQYHRITHQETFTAHEAHKRHGPVIRLAPNEVSVNCVDGGIRTIYTGGYEKGDWYPNVFNNYNLRPMFAMEDRGAHSKRKRMISNVYAKSTLLKSRALELIIDTVLSKRLLPQLQSIAEKGAVLDIYDIFCAATLDVVSCYAVGLNSGSNLVQDLPRAAKFARAFKGRQIYTVWPQDLPRFTAFMTKLGLRQLIIPDDAERTYEGIEDWVKEMCKGAETSVKADVTPQSEDFPTVYTQLRSGMLKESGRKQEVSDADQLEIASELVDHTMAGFDTSSITLTWLAWELGRPQNALWQQKLNQELRDAGRTLDMRTIDNLPILEAILMESLRLHAAIPGNQPRVTPANATIGPPGQEYHGLPANVRVQAQAWSLHRNPDVFPDPEEWQPARWLDASEAQRKEMARWFWAFGSGGRMCVGSNLAMLDMKAIISTIWSNFSTSIVFDEGMVPNGGYEAEPIGVDGRILELRLTALR